MKNHPLTPILIAVLSFLISCKNKEDCKLKVFISYDEDSNFLTAEADGGADPFVYYWSNGETSQGINPNQWGTYTVTVNDVFGCEATATYDFSSFCPDSVMDADGNYYTVIKIAGRCWTATNLITTGFGQIIMIGDSASWVTTTLPAYCYYNNDPAYGDIYGKLYNFFAIDSLNPCPEGFHIPTKLEWESAINYYGGYLLAGLPLQSDTSLFLLHGGYRRPESQFGEIDFAGEFWSSTTDGTTTHSWGYDVYNLSPVISDSFMGKRYGLSCRCIND